MRSNGRIQRELYQEWIELKEKTNKLEWFIEGADYTSLSEDMQRLLIGQYGAMKSYSYNLLDRHKLLWKEDEESNES